MSFQEYIFCPLCGEHEWITDKTAVSYTYHTCGGCKNFMYATTTKTVVSENTGIKLFYRELHEEDVKIPDHYRIKINHTEQRTIITDADSWQVLLDVKAAPKFNWYDKEEDLASRIKKFLVFS